MHWKSVVRNVVTASACLVFFQTDSVQSAHAEEATVGEATAEAATVTRKSPPNLLLILADDLGFSDLGCYGGEIETPNLDRLAARGLRYTQFYNTARCWPTRAALLTGYYAQQVNRDNYPGQQWRNHKSARPAWAPLLPVLLKQCGYRTYHSGKWHLDGQPLANGFDHSYDLRDFDRNFGTKKHFEDGRALPAIEPGTDWYSTTAVADHAIKYLTEHARTHAEQPFFQYLAFSVPHFPLHAPKQDIEKYAGRYDAGWDQIRKERFERLTQKRIVDCELSAAEPERGPPYDFPDDIAKLGTGEINKPVAWTSLTVEQQRFQIAKMEIHAAMVDRMDQEIGRVLQQIETMDATEHTLVIFLSDNGASAEIMVRGDGHDPQAAPGSAESYLCLGPGWSTCSNAPFRRHKTWVHEGGIATPLILSWPGGFESVGEFRSTVGHVVDMFPTLLELAAANVESQQRPAWPMEDAGQQPPGKSLATTLHEDVPIEREFLWWLHEGHRAIRVGDWKLVAAANDPWELYDLAADRSETQDLAKAKPELVRQLRTKWTDAAETFRFKGEEANK